MSVPESWRLTYPGTDLFFGGLTDLATFGEAPEVGSAEIASEDATRPRGDGVLFGNDFLGARTITFPTLYVVAEDGETASSAISRLAAVWRADAVRSTPGATAQLVIPRASGNRVTFGRPRRFAQTDEDTPQGLGVVVADFACASPDFFSESVSSQEVRLVPALGGGLLAPLSAPLSTSRSSDRSTVVTIDSELPAWPVVTIFGPVINPVVEVPGAFRIQLLTTLAYDQSVTIDASPWARSIIRSDGVSLAGTPSRLSTRLGDAAMPSGTHELTFAGQDSTGTARALLSWRQRYASI